MTNEAYVNQLLENASDENHDVTAVLKDYYLTKLESGALDRAQVAWQIAETVTLYGVDGTPYVIEGFDDTDNA